MEHPTQVLPERVAKHVTVNEDGCWVWSRAANNAGYGVAWWDSRLWRVHRLAWVGAGRELIDDLVLDHLCRNRACSNPNHLRQITRGENVMAEGSLSLGARKKAQTHCLRGHEFTPENTRVRYRKGVASGRECRACAAFHQENRKLRGRTKVS